MLTKKQQEEIARMSAECEKINAHLTFDASDIKHIEELAAMFKGGHAFNQPIEFETQSAQISRVLRKQQGYEDMTEEKFNSLSKDEQSSLYLIQQHILKKEWNEQLKKNEEQLK